MTESAFWDDLAADLEDPEFLREYVVESCRIATVDRIVDTLDDARTAAGLSKAALARAIGQQPAVVRRLFSAPGVNPTLGTPAEVAAALGLRITLEPLPAADRRRSPDRCWKGAAPTRGPWPSIWAPCARGAGRSRPGPVDHAIERGFRPRYSSPSFRTAA